MNFLNLFALLCIHSALFWADSRASISGSHGSQSIEARSKGVSKSIEKKKHHHDSQSIGSGEKIGSDSQSIGGGSHEKRKKKHKLVSGV